MTDSHFTGEAALAGGPRRGKLRVFVGYAPGAGQIAAMLGAAMEQREEGVAAMSAVLDPGPDREAEERLRRLDVYAVLELDRILERHPQLVLVDDLAQANPPGARHIWRYQDVEDLLSAGIDVYATLDIGQLESLSDIVAQITGQPVRDTIPDRLLDEAHEIQLVDLPPEELLRRFHEGRIRIPEAMVQDAAQFYRLGNLTALRELAMRRAARWVDERMRSYMQARAIAGPWAAAERVLACVSTRAGSEQVVRAARRLADQLNAEWFALHVETPREAGLTEAQRDRLARALRLGEELGGKAVTLPGTSVAQTVLDYARAHNVTKVVVASPVRRRWPWATGMAEQMIRHAGSIDVQVVATAPQAERPTRAEQRTSRRRWSAYALSLALVAAASLVSAVVQPYISPANLVMLYLLAVVVAAVYLGRGPAALASVAGVLALDFFFVPPSLTLVVADTEYVLTFLGLLSVGLLVSSLTAQVRNQVESARRRELETATLYALSSDLAAVEGLDAIVRAIVDNVGQTFGRQVTVLLPAPNAHPVLQPHRYSADFSRDAHESAVAEWAYQHERPAGRGTETFPKAGAYYLPLRTARGIVGILGAKPLTTDRLLSAEERRLLEALANQAALAIERAQLAEAAQRAQLLAATEKLQSALLNSISHDLRTPLVSITGVLSSLEDDDAPLDAATRRALIETAREEAERLNRLVGNLLNMSRIEAGAVRIAWELEDVGDVIGSALEQLKPRQERHIEVDVPSSLPFVPMDFVLIVQVLVNVIDNAIKYSPPDAPIEIRARETGDEVWIEVADRGIGIPPEDLDRIFDKFFRVQRPDNVAGTGLGLSISKGLVEAHEGRIWAENRAGGGTVVTVALRKEQSGG